MTRVQCKYCLRPCRCITSYCLLYFFNIITSFILKSVPVHRYHCIFKTFADSNSENVKQNILPFKFYHRLYFIIIYSAFFVTFSTVISLTSLMISLVPRTLMSIAVRMCSSNLIVAAAWNTIFTCSASTCRSLADMPNPGNDTSPAIADTLW